MARTRKIPLLANRPAVLTPLQEMASNPALLTGHQSIITTTNHVSAVALKTPGFEGSVPGAVALRLPTGAQIHPLQPYMLTTAAPPGKGKRVQPKSLPSNTFNLSEKIHGLAFSPVDGSRLAAATSEGVTLWRNLEPNPRVMDRLSGGTTAIGWTGDGSVLLAGQMRKLAYWPQAATEEGATMHSALRAIDLGVGQIRHILPLPGLPSAVVAGSNGVAKLTFERGRLEQTEVLRDTQALGFEGLALGAGNLYALTSTGELLAWRFDDAGLAGHPLVLLRNFSTPKALVANDRLLIVRDYEGLHIHRTHPYEGLALLEAHPLDGSDHVLGLVDGPKPRVLLSRTSNNQLLVIELDPDATAAARGQPTLAALPWEQVEVEPEAPEPSEPSRRERVRPSFAKGPDVPDPSSGGKEPSDDLKTADDPTPDDENDRIVEVVEAMVEEEPEDATPEPVEQPARPSAGHFSTRYSTLGREAKDDFLGFAPYVRAVSRFLRSKDTEGPLTLAIEGRWGTGKTTFMRLLQENLQGEKRERSEAEIRNPPKIVTFNAWRHDKAESLWASLALALMNQLRPKGIFRWGWANLNLTWKRIRGGRVSRFRFVIGILALLSALVLWLFGVTALLWGQSPWVQSILDTLVANKARGAVELFAKGGGVLGLTTLTALFSQWASKELIDPLRERLAAMVSVPDYQAHVPFIDTFHKDVGDILTAYVGDARVYIFVDDLDRCEVPRAADLIQAINLLIGDQENVFFIIGMDRQVVAAGLAAKYSNLKDFIGNGEGGSPTEMLRFGHEFVEKFVQLSIAIPRPSPFELRQLLRGERLQSPKAEAGTRGVAGSKSPPTRSTPEEAGTGSAEVENTARPPSAGQVEGLTEGAAPPPESVDPTADATPRPDAAPSPTTAPATTTANAAAPVVPRSLQTKRESVDSTEDTEPLLDSDRALNIALTFAPFLDHNPRKVKAFHNTLRLRCAIARELNALDDRPETWGGTVTPEKIGKVIALEMVAPMLSRRLLSEPQWLGTLQDMVIGHRIAEQRHAQFRSNGDALPPWLQSHVQGLVSDVLRVGITSAHDQRQPFAGFYRITGCEPEILFHQGLSADYRAIFEEAPPP